MSRRSKRISLPTPGTLADRMQARIARMLDEMVARDREDSGRPPPHRFPRRPRRRAHTPFPPPRRGRGIPTVRPALRPPRPYSPSHFR